MGLKAKNSTRGPGPLALFLVTRPQPHTDKSDVTRRNRALIAMLYVLRMCACTCLFLLFAIVVNSLNRECNYCTQLQKPTIGI